MNDEQEVGYSEGRQPKNLQYDLVGFHSSNSPAEQRVTDNWLRIIKKRTRSPLCSGRMILIEAPSPANPVTNKEETSMRFYNTQHPFYCGIDLHARMMYVCILNQSGEILVHRNMNARSTRF